FGCREESTTARKERAVHEIRIVLLLEAFICLPVERRHPWIVRFCRVEERILHSERRKDALRCKLVKLHPRGAFDDEHKRVKTRLRAVSPSGARLKFQRHLSESRDVVRIGFLAFQGNLGVFAITDWA